MNNQKPQIPNLVAAGLTGLNDLFTSLSAHGSPSEVASIESHLSRFKLWAGSLGAHRVSGTRSLEYRLRDASSIRKHLVSLLEDLTKLIVIEALPLVQNGFIQNPVAETDEDAADGELAAYFDEDDDDDDETGKPSDTRGKELKHVFFQIGGVIDCLLRLSVTISNPAPHDRFKSRAGAQVGYYEPWDVQHVTEKFPHVDEEIAKRLGRALTHRRKYFKYRENHYCRLKEGLEGDDDGMSKGKATTVASSLPHKFKDADAQNIELFDGDRSEVSETVYAPSTLNQGQLRVPPMPKEYAEGPFLCPFCYVFISVDSRHEWKRHVFRDLRPYICLSKTCVAADQDFQRRKDWSRHMFEEHWRKWSCPFGCTDSLTSSSKLRQHLADRHGTGISGDDTRSIISLGSQSDLQQSEGTCPLCRNFEMKANSRARSYESHIGHHLEQLALFVLPFQDDDSDGSNDNNDDEGEDDSDHERTEDGEENPTGHGGNASPHRQTGDGKETEIEWTRDPVVATLPETARKERVTLDGLIDIGKWEKERASQWQAPEESLRSQEMLQTLMFERAKESLRSQEMLQTLMFERAKELTTEVASRAGRPDLREGPRQTQGQPKAVHWENDPRSPEKSLISSRPRATTLGPGRTDTLVSPTLDITPPQDNGSIGSDDEDDDVYVRRTISTDRPSPAVLMYLAGAKPDDDPQATEPSETAQGEPAKYGTGATTPKKPSEEDWDDNFDFEEILNHRAS